MASNSTEKAKTGLDREAVEKLVRQAQGGDAEAFDALVRNYSGPMFNLAYRMVGNHADAADMTQEIFVKLYRAIGKFKWRSSFNTWMYTLAANTCRSGLRRLARVSKMEVVRLDREDAEGHQPPEPPDPGDLPATTLERREKAETIQAAIDSLPEDFKEIVVLRDIQDLAYEEIATVLKCSVGTVKSRLARARGRLKDKLVRQGLVCAAKR